MTESFLYSDDMQSSKDTIRVVAADPVKGDLIVHFSDGSSILYHAHFLQAVRHDDGNVPLSDPSELELD